MKKRILDYVQALGGYWPTARALSSNSLSAFFLFLTLLSVPIRKRIFGRTPKKLRISIDKKTVISFFVRDGMDISVLREMFVGQEYRFAETVSYTPHHIADMGAHIGASALFLRNLYPDAQITAYEPDPENFAFLLKNVGNRENITCIHAVVSNSPESKTFYSDVASTRASIRSPGNMKGVSLPSVVFDDVIKKGVDFVKFDVEGDEYDIFGAASKESLQKVGVYVGELHFAIMNKTQQQFEALFPGYSFVWRGAIVAIIRK